MHHSIPTEDMRMHQNMSATCTCAICGMLDSWRHNLLDCTAARCVWSLVDKELIEELMENNEQNARTSCLLCLSSSRMRYLLSSHYLAYMVGAAQTDS